MVIRITPQLSFVCVAAWLALAAAPASAQVCDKGEVNVCAVEGAKCAPPAGGMCKTIKAGGVPDCICQVPPAPAPAPAPKKSGGGLEAIGVFLGLAGVSWLWTRARRKA